MENNNQKIIFLVSEETTPAEIILDILEKNGFVEPDDDLENDDETRIPRLVLIHNAAKDLFDKKITEENMLDLFQRELKVPKETATEIINGLKARLIPFGKKINIPTDEKTIPKAALPKIEFPSVSEKITNEEEPEQNFARPTAPVEEKSKIRKFPEIKQSSRPNIAQKKGPDSYREPIE